MKIMIKYDLLDHEGAIVKPMEGPAGALDGARVVIEFEGNKSEYWIDYEEQEDLIDWLNMSSQWKRCDEPDEEQEDLIDWLNMWKHRCDEPVTPQKRATVTTYSVAWNENNKPYMKAHIWANCRLWSEL